MRKYERPKFLLQDVSQRKYGDWLQRRAAAHVRRDRKYAERMKQSVENITVALYKTAIHNAVLSSKGRDAYTGKWLNWKQISTWNNEEARLGGTRYKKRYAMLPTADHVLRWARRSGFRICAWCTNDAKSDLSYEEFVDLCETVVQFAARSKA